MRGVGGTPCIHRANVLLKCSILRLCRAWQYTDQTFPIDIEEEFLIFNDFPSIFIMEYFKHKIKKDLTIMFITMQKRTINSSRPGFDFGLHLFLPHKSCTATNIRHMFSTAVNHLKNRSNVYDD